MKQTNWGLFRFAGRKVIISLLCVGAICSHAQTVTSLFSFNLANGAEPDIVLTQARDGALYGMTGTGGLYNAGTVFRFDPTTGTLTTLYNFCTQPGCTDGANAPLGGGALALGTDGNLYGATSLGGLYSGCNQPSQTNGTIFKITPDGVLTTLHSFNSTDGGFPNGLIQGSDGNFYGTTQQCGKNPGHLINAGTVFKMTRGGKVTTLYNFCSQPGCADGGTPGSAPIQAADGNFYGTTFGGGPSGGGVVYKITPKGKYTVVADIGGSPGGPLVQDGDGNFYGTESRANSAFKMAPDGTLIWTVTVGGYPYAGLALATDQKLYGTTYGSNTLFQITPDGGVTPLYTFCLTDCSDGNAPLAGLMQATDGPLYGVTIAGGTETCDFIFGVPGCGTIFSLDMGLGPFVEALTYSGKVGKTIEFLGQGFDKSTTVSFNGVTAKRSIKSGTYLTAKVPVGATTGYVTITTKSGTLTSNQKFMVIP